MQCGAVRGVEVVRRWRKLVYRSVGFFVYFVKLETRVKCLNLSIISLEKKNSFRKVKKLLLIRDKCVPLLKKYFENFTNFQ